MNEKRCFFIGCRYAPDSIEEKLTNLVEQHITEYNVTTFTVGHYGNFDRIIIGILRKAKKQHQNIKLYLLTPYALSQKIIEAPEGFDGTIYPYGLEKVPYRFAIIQANRYMIKNSEYLIAYPSVGNSGKIVEYAKNREKKGLIKITLLY